MSESIPTKHSDGDLSVGRHVATGGNATVRGCAKIGHHLKVEGWLDAPNIKGASKGLFLNETDLKKAYPRPQNGWWALVGESLPADVWTAWGGEWIPAGRTEGITVVNETDPSVLEHLSDLENRLSAAQEEAQQLRERLAALEKRCQCGGGGGNPTEPGTPAETQMSAESGELTVDGGSTLTAIEWDAESGNLIARYSSDTEHTPDLYGDMLTGWIKVLLN